MHIQREERIGEGSRKMGTLALYLGRRKLQCRGAVVNQQQDEKVVLRKKKERMRRWPQPEEIRTFERGRRRVHAWKFRHENAHCQGKNEQEQKRGGTQPAG